MWGGIRIICCGDFFQLNGWKITTKGENKTTLLFRHKTWKNSKFKPLYLREIVRTTDNDLLYVLNHVRVGKIDEKTSKLLDR
jgi:ATP-dependent DNA helicase PIF1